MASSSPNDMHAALLLIVDHERRKNVLIAHVMSLEVIVLFLVQLLFLS